MRSIVTKRGQTVVPAPIRKKYGIRQGTTLVWIDTGETIKVIPVPENTLKVLRGIARGEGLVKKLFKERKKDGSKGQAFSS